MDILDEIQKDCWKVQEKIVNHFSNTNSVTPFQLIFIAAKDEDMLDELSKPYIQKGFSACELIDGQANITQDDQKMVIAQWYCKK